MRSDTSDVAREIDSAIEGIDPCDPQSIEDIVAKIGAIDGRLDQKSYAFQKLRTRVSYANRERHMQAIVATSNLELFVKTELLSAAKAEWLQDSPTEMSALRQMALSLAGKHAEELLTHQWGFTSDLKALCALGGPDIGDLALILVETAAAQGIAVGATAWLNLATLLSPKADPRTSRSALERLLDSDAAKLADSVGDGPWHRDLDGSSDSAEMSAGLIWLCLGAPETVVRWRAAHAVRALAHLGRWPVIQALFNFAQVPGAGQFQDQKLPFFSMHAKLWFLLAIARVALDYPTTIAKHCAALLGIATDEAFPHVAMRAAARRAFFACFEHVVPRPADAIVRQLEAINKSPFSNVERVDSKFGPYHGGRPEGVPVPQPEFHFEYEFDKHDLSGLGDLFGLPKWQAGDACVRWIRQFDTKITSMHDRGGRRGRGSRYDYTRDSDESVQGYGTYLAWHALLLSGGEFLQQKLLVVSRYDVEAWDDWVSRFSPTRQDGLWLSDGTSQVPLMALLDLSNGDDEKRVPTSIENIIVSLGGLTQIDFIRTALTVDAYWDSPDKVRVHISSALVPNEQAEIVGLAVATARPLDMWLPTLQASDEGDTNRYATPTMVPCEAWITDEDAYAKIDDRDPFGSKAAVARPRPSKAIQTEFDLSIRDPFAQQWLNKDGHVALQSLAWGYRRGSGEREVHEIGHSLTCEPEFLRTVLTRLNRSLLLLINLQCYNEARSSSDDKKSTSPDDDAGGGGFTHSWVVAIVDQSLRVAIVHPSTSVIAAVSKLPAHVQHDFGVRLAAIREVHSSSA